MPSKERKGWSHVCVLVLVAVSLCGFCVCVCLWMKGWSTCVFVVGFLFDVDLCIALFCFIQRCLRVLCAVVCCVRDLVFCFQEWAFISFPIYLFLCVCVHMAVLCFPRGSVSRLVAWGAYDHFDGCLGISEFIDLCVSSWGWCDEVHTFLAPQLCLLRVWLKWRRWVGTGPWYRFSKLAKLPFFLSLFFFFFLSFFFFFFPSCGFKALLQGIDLPRYLIPIMYFCMHQVPTVHIYWSILRGVYICVDILSLSLVGWTRCVFPPLAAFGGSFSLSLYEVSKASWPKPGGSCGGGSPTRAETIEASAPFLNLLLKFWFLYPCSSLGEWLTSHKLLSLPGTSQSYFSSHMRTFPFSFVCILHWIFHLLACSCVFYFILLCFLSGLSESPCTNTAFPGVGVLLPYLSLTSSTITGMEHNRYILGYF